MQSGDSLLRSSGQRVLIHLAMYLLIVGACVESIAATQERVGRPKNGIPIALAFPPSDHSEVRVTAFTKDDKTFDLDVRKLPNGIVMIDTFAFEASQEEERQGSWARLSKSGRTPYVFGLEDRNHQWHNFDGIDHLVIEHVRITPDETYDAYQYWLAVVWNKDKKYFSIQHGRNHDRRAEFVDEDEVEKKAGAADLGQRLIGRRLALVLESEKGNPLRAQEKELISVEIQSGGRIWRQPVHGGEEIRLEPGDRIRACELGAETARNFTLGAPCDSTWSADAGPVKIILTSRRVNFQIPFVVDGEGSAPQADALSVQLVGADGTLTLAKPVTVSENKIAVEGASTAVAARIALSGDSNFEDLAPTDLSLVSGTLKLVRRRGGVVIVLHASSEFAPVRNDVFPQIFDAIQRLGRAPGKFLFGVSSGDGVNGYRSFPTPAAFENYVQTLSLSNTFEPREGIAAAQRDAAVFQNEATTRSKIVFITNASIISNPWFGSPPYDSSKTDLFVFEIGAEGAMPRGKEFFLNFFGADAQKRYRFVEKAADVRDALTGFVLQ